MEILYLTAGGILGAALMYFLMKSYSVSRNIYEDKNSLLIRTQADLSNLTQKNEELLNSLYEEKNRHLAESDLLNDLKNEFSTLSARHQSLLEKYEELKNDCEEQQQKATSSLTETQELFSKNAELMAHNRHLETLLNSQKEEITRLQEQTKQQFENLANKILEEKTEKFTLQNQQQLKNILQPFQEKIIDLKNRVNDAYDKESKERFSLAEKVKELATLNQQISEDARKLTRALKGESKTQGRWGEMILESILEKSGLTKGREYFLEHELRDENNRALYSEFSGKKMRPDAVVKYPDDRNVIIDSKVSLTAFTDLIGEEDPTVYQIKLRQHLTSVRNHILELSAKAYDDYGKSLDFVMMFIPSEPAYIAAIQADPQLWNFAYDKRILLLNPGNLITSLKLIEDLWKREYQNRNALEIAERGARLYDKFVGFIENLEKVGKNISAAQDTYISAYKQLSTGNDNLVLQTQKLRDLGVKSRKQIPNGLLDAAQNHDPHSPTEEKE